MTSPKTNPLWPKESAGAHLTTRVPVVLHTYSVKKTLEHISQNIRKFDTINYVYIVDAKDTLKRVVSIKELYRHPETSDVGSIGVGSKDIFSIHPEADQEKVVKIALRKNIKAVPVLSSQGAFLGVVPSDQILHILNKEFREDVLHSVGIDSSEIVYDNVMSVPILTSFRNRAPWVLIGLIGSLVLAQIIGLFGNTLEQDIMLAAFLPLIVYISNAVGMQVQTVFVRDLASGHTLAYGQYILRQVVVSLLIATAGAAVLLVLSALFWQTTSLSVVVATSIMLSILASVFLSLLVPLALEKLKKDPAIGSGPFVTILQDAISVIIYFSIATLLL